MRYFLAFLMVSAIMIISILGIGWSGVYNVAAVEPDWPAVAWFLNMVKAQSVRLHSKMIQMPEGNPQGGSVGFEHFHAMCRRCHGAPGSERAEFSRGLNPSPPYLASGYLQKQYYSTQIYWIIKNGIKMTGMPAFGLTHDDREIYEIVSFLNKLPQMESHEYPQMLEKLKLKKDGQSLEPIHDH